MHCPSDPRIQLFPFVHQDVFSRKLHHSFSLSPFVFYEIPGLKVFWLWPVRLFPIEVVACGTSSLPTVVFRFLPVFPALFFVADTVCWLIFSLLLAQVFPSLVVLMHFQLLSCELSLKILRWVLHEIEPFFHVRVSVFVLLEFHLKRNQ